MSRDEGISLMYFEYFVTIVGAVALIVWGMFVALKGDANTVQEHESARVEATNYSYAED